MARVYLGVGSNVCREHNIRSGLQALGELFLVERMSSVYESEAVGFCGDAFYNLVVQVATDLPVASMQKALRDIEDAHGRSREGSGFGARTLDIDILLYDSVVGCIDGVMLPREEILFNAFVLWPLAEIAGAAMHPQAGKSYAQLWEEFDKSQQQIHRLNLGLGLLARV